MTATARTNRLIGAALRRKEDPRFLRGRATFVDDLRRPAMVHAAFFRSDVAHGLLTSIDITAALQVPGVLNVFTRREIGPLLRPLIARNSRPSYHESEVPILPAEKVVYVVSRLPSSLQKVDTKRKTGPTRSASSTTRFHRSSI
jgi:carbon-monoxide dehydrogenase large subunit